LLVAVVFGPTSVCVGLGQAASTSRRAWAFLAGYLRFLEGLREDFSFQEPRTVAKFAVWEQERFRLWGGGWRRSKFNSSGKKGASKEVPHFGELEDVNQKSGPFLSRLSQSRLAIEVAQRGHERARPAAKPASSRCSSKPGPDTTVHTRSWDPRLSTRQVTGIFRSARGIRFDRRASTPRMTAAAILVVGETRYFQRAGLTLKHGLGNAPSSKAIERCLTHEIKGGRRLFSPSCSARRCSCSASNR